MNIHTNIRKIITINQDPLGKQGGLIGGNGDNHLIWMRELANETEIAIVLQNTQTSNAYSELTFDLSMVPITKWNQGTQFFVRDILNRVDLNVYTKSFSALIQPSSVGMYKLTLL